MQTNSSVRDAQSNLIPIQGKFSTDVKLQDDSAFGTFYVTNTHECNLFGIDLITTFKLWDNTPSTFCRVMKVPSINKAESIQALKDEFSEVFTESLGLCTKISAKLHLKPHAVPVFRQKCPVPCHLMETIEEELQRLQNLDIITPVESSDWAAPIVAVRKSNGKIRLVGDYSTGLNDCLEPSQYPIPSATEVYNKLTSGQVFSKIDLSDAYLQIKVDDDARKMLTIHTHKGLFKFNRLCPGVKAAPGIFQQIVEQMVLGIDGVAVYFDDIAIASRCEESHLKTLRAVLTRLRDYGFHIRLEKCQFFLPEIKFLGNIIDQTGCRLDPEKIQAISQMLPPRDVGELRSFLRAINQVHQGNESLEISHGRSSQVRCQVELVSRLSKIFRSIQGDFILRSRPNSLFSGETSGSISRCIIQGSGSSNFTQIPGWFRESDCLRESLIDKS